MTKYKISNGNVYTVFRETISDEEYHEKEVTLIIGFKLKVIGKNSVLHFLFQKLSILDTPIWVGFKGFITKLWMVDIRTKDYLGLYRYQGRKNALTYANYITSILIPLSVSNSVWYKIINSNLNHYTEKILIK